MTSRRGSRSRAWTMLTVSGLAALTVTLAGCGSSATAQAAPAPPRTESVVPAAATTTDTPAGARTPSQTALYTAMRGLFAQHMEWTYDTVAAFAAGTRGLTPSLDRLLKNQVDIGDAVKPYYGAAAGAKLTELLQTHIKDYVPVLQAAKAGDQAKVKKAFAAVLANGVEIGKFLEQANPNWAAPALEAAFTTHNNQTLAYAAAQLKRDYAASVTGYDKAEAHMMEMADILAGGIIKQFPDKFNS